jgi:hypothetical protein
MFDEPRSIPLPFDPCPPADDPEAILIWLHWQHLRSGRIEKRQEHHDPFWRRIEEKQRDRLRYAEEFAEHANWAEHLQELAQLFALDLTGLSKEEQIHNVVRSLVPMRFHLSGELKQLGLEDRAAEVFAAAY